MAETVKNGITAKALISAITLGVAVAGLALAWYVSITRPKLIPQPSLTVTATTLYTSLPCTTILIQNSGQAVAHDVVLYIRYSKGAKISLLEEGVFDLVEGKLGEISIKLYKTQIAPRVALPPILVAAEKNTIFIEPIEIYAESREQLEIPVYSATVSAEVD